MKILVVTRGYPQEHNNQLGLFECDQANALLEYGHEVAYAVVDIRSFRRKRKFGYNHYVKDGLPIYEMNYPIGPMPRFMIEKFRSRALLHLYKYIEKDFGKPDIIHSHFLNYGVISVELSKKMNIPMVITEHSSYLNTSVLKKNIYKRAIKAYSASSSIITVSQSLSENLKQTTGFNSVVIPNIVNTRNFNVDVCNHKVQNTFRFVSAGNLIKRKGFDLLLKAFKEVQKKYPNVELTIYGDGPEKKSLMNNSRKLGLLKKVKFYGRFNRCELATFYLDADAFVLSSLAETFGVVYIEAMACGLPVIATKCGGPVDIVNNNNGYLVNPGDVDSLVDGMILMINNIDKFDKEQIIYDTKRLYSHLRVAEQITKVFNDVLK